MVIPHVYNIRIMFRTRYFIVTFSLFILLQIIICFTILLFHNAIPFESTSYLYASHHYVQDLRATGGAFSFLRSLGVWDAQWYLRIADAGYPSRAVFDAHPDPRYMGALSYAFFPLYPLVLALFNFALHNIELAAFIVANLLLIANFFSMYYVVTRLFSKEIAVKTICLAFLFPFSIFYRSYFTESLFLLLLLWYGYFLIKQKWFLSTVLGSLLFVTRPNGLFLIVVYVWQLVIAIRKKKSSWIKLLYIPLSLIPLFLWCLYCLKLTGNPFYWHKVQSIWFKSPSIGATFFENVQHMLGFFNYPLHSTRDSQIDIVMVLITAGLLVWSKRFFKKYPQLWWISFMIWLTPLIVKDLMSYSRYQVISYPLFIFLASKVTGWKFYVLCGIFFALLLFTSVYFVNWQWVG
jgi:Gpi18-like mannosyltransferase